MSELVNYTGVSAIEYRLLSPRFKVSWFIVDSTAYAPSFARYSLLKLFS